MTEDCKRRTTAAEWNLERAQEHMANAQTAISRGAGLRAAADHMVQARVCFLRAHAGRENHPVVVGLLVRLDAMHATCVAHGNGGVLA